MTEHTHLQSSLIPALHIWSVYVPGSSFNSRAVESQSVWNSQTLGLTHPDAQYRQEDLDSLRRQTSGRCLSVGEFLDSVIRV